MKSLRDRVAFIVQGKIVARLQGLSFECADAVIAEFRQSSMSDLFGGAEASSTPAKTATPAKRGPGRPKGGTNKPKAAKVAKAPKVDGDRFTSDKVAAAALEIVKILKAAPGPMSTEEIRAKYQIEKPHWGRVSTYLRDQKLVKTSGAKRDMRFTLRDNAAAKKAAEAPAVVANSVPDVAGTEIDKPAEMLL